MIPELENHLSGKNLENYYHGKTLSMYLADSKNASYGQKTKDEFVKENSENKSKERKSEITFISSTPLMEKFIDNAINQSHILVSQRYPPNIIL